LASDRRGFDKRFRWHVWWRRCLGFHFGARRFCCGLLGNLLDNGLAHFLFHYWRALGWLRACDQGGRHLDDFTFHDRAQIFRGYSCAPLEAKPLDRLLTPRAELVIIRSLINDDGIVVSDVGDVGRLIHDRHVLLGWNDDALDSF
jgi:hypothetical protein